MEGVGCGWVVDVFFEGLFVVLCKGEVVRCVGDRFLIWVNFGMGVFCVKIDFSVVCLYFFLCL